jgi:hypothetical protein
MNQYNFEFLIENELKQFGILRLYERYDITNSTWLIVNETTDETKIESSLMYYINNIYHKIIK